MNKELVRAKPGRARAHLLQGSRASAGCRQAIRKKPVQGEQHGTRRPRASRQGNLSRTRAGAGLLSLLRHRRPGRDEAGAADRARSIRPSAACWCSAIAAPASPRRCGRWRRCCRRCRWWSAAATIAIRQRRRLVRRMPPRRRHGALKRTACPVPVVDLPLGATEDRVVGALDLERALAQGEKAFEPGLLARAHRGFLYIDEVNLLEDHLVDLLLDVAASGENVVEREGLSIRHPARFVLVGSGNPEEGELRPQLLDRFGLSVEVQTPTICRAASRWCAAATLSSATRRRSSRAGSEQEREAAPQDRGGARAHWPRSRCPTRCWSGRAAVHGARHRRFARRTDVDARRARAGRARRRRQPSPTRICAQSRRSALRHRLRRNPLDDAGSSVRVERAVAEMFGRVTARLSRRSDAVRPRPASFAVDPVGLAACCCGRARARSAIAGSRCCARAAAGGTVAACAAARRATDRLLGGLDLAATLRAGRPVAAARPAGRGRWRRRWCWRWRSGCSPTRRPRSQRRSTRDGGARARRAVVAHPGAVRRDRARRRPRGRSGPCARCAIARLPSRSRRDRRRDRRRTVPDHAEIVMRRVRLLPR